MTQNVRVITPSHNGPNAIVAVGAEAFAFLTERQAQVLDKLASGLTNKEIASELGVSTSTIKTHVLFIYQKTSCSSRIQLALNWLQFRGLIAFQA